MRLQSPAGTKTLHVGAYARGGSSRTRRSTCTADKPVEVALQGDDAGRRRDARHGVRGAEGRRRRPRGAHSAGRAARLPRAGRAPRPHRDPGQAAVHARATRCGSTSPRSTEKGKPTPAVLLVGVVNRSVITMADNKTDRLHADALPPLGRGEAPGGTRTRRLPADRPPEGRRRARPVARHAGLAAVRGAGRRTRRTRPTSRTWTRCSSPTVSAPSAPFGTVQARRAARERGVRAAAGAGPAARRRSGTMAAWNSDPARGRCRSWRRSAAAAVPPPSSKPRTRGRPVRRIETRSETLARIVLVPCCSSSLLSVLARAGRRCDRCDADEPFARVGACSSRGRGAAVLRVLLVAWHVVPASMQHAPKLRLGERSRPQPRRAARRTRVSAARPRQRWKPRRRRALGAMSA